MLTIEIPRPKNWQDFEKVVESFAAIRWPECNVVQYGSNGQGQHGVDIYMRDSSGGFTGIQCKRVTRLPFKTIEQEVEKAAGFKPALKHYIIATTVKRNAELQEKVNVLSLQRSQKRLFTIDIVFWEDIESVLRTDSKALEQLYPEFFYKDFEGDNIHINSHNNQGMIVGKIINFPKRRDISKAHDRRGIDETIGSNTFQKNYVRSLIDKYFEFKKDDFKDEGQMNYPLFYKTIQREIGFKWDETPCELFDDLCQYLQNRIDNTRIGRGRKKRGQKNYSTYEEFVEKKFKGKQPQK